MIRIALSCRFLGALCLVFGLLFHALPASANAGGGGAPEPMVFTVNAGPTQYLQFGIIFETGKPESMGLITAYKPKIQHQIILLLATKNVETLRTLEGKKDLVEEIIELVNHIIDEDHKTGVHEVLFTRFLIQ